jgi:hypothetical protein
VPYVNRAKERIFRYLHPRNNALSASGQLTGSVALKENMNNPLKALGNRIRG